MTSTFARGGSSAAARGAVLVAVAVVIGVVLLSRGFDTGSFVATGGDDAAADDAAGGDDPSTPGDPDTEGGAGTGGGTEPGAEDPLVPPPTTAPDPNEILPDPRPPAEVSAVVLNGSDPPVAGAAGAFTDQLTELGYTTLSPANTDPLPTTTVYFAEDYQADAEALAAAVGAPPGSVAPLPEPAPEGTEGANVVLVVAADLAAAGGDDTGATEGGSPDPGPTGDETTGDDDTDGTG